MHGVYVCVCVGRCCKKILKNQCSTIKVANYMILYAIKRKGQANLSIDEPALWSGGSFHDPL